MIYNLYKQRGETPLERITRFAKVNPELKGQKMTYLGRLDPLAEGVLLMASGDDVKRKEEFLGLDKEYDFVSLFGFATDTYDVLGKILRVEKLNEILENDVRRAVFVYEGEREQKYPEYSSKIIASPLTPLQRRGEKQKPNNFSSPSLGEGVGGWAKKITIHKLQFHGLDTLNSKELFGRLLMDISKVKGDFRQHEILTLWNGILFNSENPSLLGRGKGVGLPDYYLGRFSAHVSSGTYIRGLVNDIGNTLGCGATTLSIRRTRVGNYKIENSLT